jgi:hypothetical protein
MTASGKSVGIIVLSYLLFGLFNLVQFGVFVVPVPYTELIVFMIVSVVFTQNWKQLKRYHIFLFSYALIGFVLHPFLWEIFLNREQQFILVDSIFYDILRIIELISLITFFVLLSYDRDKNLLKIEWLIPAILGVVCFFNPPMWYLSMLFILSGLSAFYTLRRRTIGTDFTMEILIGMGIIYAVNLFYY